MGNEKLGFVQYFKEYKSLPCYGETFGKTKSWARKEAKKEFLYL